MGYRRIRPNQSRGIPRLRRFLVPRPRLMTHLSELLDYPLTVIKAGAGYGKTTALSAFARSCRLPVNWLTLTAEEQDPSVFVAHLVEVVPLNGATAAERERVVETGHHPLTWSASAELFANLFHTYAVQDQVLILDDFHVVNEVSSLLAWLDIWLRRLPTELHVVLVSRTEPSLPVFHDMSLRADVLLLRERDLAFTEDETMLLFHSEAGQSGDHLDLDQLRWLLLHTRGMPMVLALLWREWKLHRSFAKLQTALVRNDSVREQIGQLCLTDLSLDARDFFVRSSILHSLTPAVCDALLDRGDSMAVLQDSERKGFLVAEEEPATYVLHPLVREYLQSMLPGQERRDLVWRVVRLFYARDQIARAIGYLFSLDDEAEIAAELLLHIPDHLARGQVSTVHGWLERLSAHSIADSPGLLHAKAEVARLSNRFAEAMKYYGQVEQTADKQSDRNWIALSHMGRARLFLDTIQPSLAENCIRTVRRTAARTAFDVRRANLQLAYENAINLGKCTRAARLGQNLIALNGAGLPANNSDARLLLRTGRIAEAVDLLNARMAEDEVSQRTALFHREAALLLALLHSMAGKPDRARDLALRGLAIGDLLQSPFVRAVGYIRLGHAQHLADPLSGDSLSSYESAVDLMEEMSVTRGKSEALMGLCLAHAYQSHQELARSCAERGIAIAERVADIWMANMVRLAYGQACCVNQSYDEALSVLGRATGEFSACGDAFLHCTGLVWHAIARSANQEAEAHDDLALALSLAFQNHCEYLFLRPTYFGLRDVQQLAPLLEEHMRRGAESALADRILQTLDCPSPQGRPGYTLRVKSLGAFRVWRGFTEISRKQWQREKARQLFQYFLTHRGVWLHREAIVEDLWSEVDADVAERDFKVALNGLSLALEPYKQGRGTTSFIARQGGYYRLTMHSMVEVDRDRFDDLVQKAQHSPSRQEKKTALGAALRLYGGDYLPDARYGSWSDRERERLQRAFLQATVAYAELCLEEREHVEVIRVCERALEADAACEELYAPLMRAYGMARNRPMVVQTYRNCRRMVQLEYGVAVSGHLTDLFRLLTGSTE